MSNRKKLDMRRLASVLSGMPVAKASAPARVVPAFPRIPLARFEELLGDAEQDAAEADERILLERLIASQAGDE